MENAYDFERKYLMQQEAADRFRIKLATVKNWKNAGHLEYFQPPDSTRVVYPRESIEDFERQHDKEAKVIDFNKPTEIKRTKPGISSIEQIEWRI